MGLKGLIGSSFADSLDHGRRRTTRSTVCYSEYAPKTDSHTTGRRHHGVRGAGGPPAGTYRHPSADLPPTTTAPSGTTAAAAAAGMAAADDGSVSDSATLFGQIPMTDDRRRHKTNPDTAAGKSSTTGAAVSSKTSSGNLLLLSRVIGHLHSVQLWDEPIAKLLGYGL